MTGAVLVDSLERDLLHLTDGTTVVQGDLALVYFANDERCSRDAGLGIRQNDF